MTAILSFLFFLALLILPFVFNYHLAKSRGREVGIWMHWH